MERDEDGNGDPDDEGSVPIYSPTLEAGRGIIILDALTCWVGLAASVMARVGYASNYSCAVVPLMVTIFLRILIIVSVCQILLNSSIYYLESCLNPSNLGNEKIIYLIIKIDQGI